MQLGRIEQLTDPPKWQVISKDKWIPDELRFKIRGFSPKSGLGKIVKQCLNYLPAELAGEVVERITSCVVLESTLAIKVFRTPFSPQLIGKCYVEDHGITSRKVVTTQGVVALCVAWGSATFAMVYMSMGTASGVEAAADTVASFVEIAAANYTGSVRPTCTHVESSNTVPLVATHTQATAGNTIEEHGIDDSATQEAGSLWDRSLTGTIVLAVGDGIQGTYTLTATAGG